MYIEEYFKRAVDIMCQSSWAKRDTYERTYAPKDPNRKTENKLNFSNAFLT